MTDYFFNQRGWVLKLLCDLLAVPSESGQEAEAMELLEERLSLLNVTCERVPISNKIKCHPDYSFPIEKIDYTGRWNLRAVIPGTGGKTIVFNSHMDVVPPLPGQDDAFVPKEEDGYICARGACDAKGQIAVMALLIKSALEIGPPKNTMVFDFVVEEELGGNGTLALLESRKTVADALVNLEPTGLRIMTSIRGAIWFDAAFTGVAGHSGSTNKSGALDKVLDVIHNLKGYHAKLLHNSKNYGVFAGIENPMPFTIGKLQAGSWPSMVPGVANLAGVMGFLPNKTKEQIIFDFKGIMGDNVKFPYRHNAVELDTFHPFSVKMAEAAKRTGINSDFCGMTASTDAIFYQERSIPSLAFGPGLLADAHSYDERVKIEDILTAARLLYDFTNIF